MTRVVVASTVIGALIAGCEGTHDGGHPGVTESQVHMEVTSQTVPDDASPALALRWRFTTPAGAPATLETLHERPLHAIAVSNDLSWFAHEHPAEFGPGEYRAQLTPPPGGSVVLFSQFKGAGLPEQVERTPLPPHGPASPAQPLVVDAGMPKAIDGYTVLLDMKVEHSTSAMLRYTITADDKPVTDLQNYLGALGHAVAISSDSERFVHVHPMEASAQTGRVEFHATFPAAGVYATWFQFQHRGRVITVPFVVRVDSAPDSDVTPAQHSHGHSHH